MRRFLVSLSLFLFAWLPMFVIGLPATFVLLLTSWDGRSTWFGNYLYGRHGNSHTPANPNMFEQWWFLAIRNPVSNFGKFTLSRGPYERAWLIDKSWGRVVILYGWKNIDMRLPGGRRAFVFRPYIK